MAILIDCCGAARKAPWSRGLTRPGQVSATPLGRGGRQPESGWITDETPKIAAITGYHWARLKVGTVAVIYFDCS